MTAAVAGVVVSLVSAAASLATGFMGDDAGDEAKELAEHNARMERMQTEEEARRLQRQNEIETGLDRARAAAAGLGGKSVESGLASAEAERRRQLNWTKQAGASRAAAISAQGSAAQSQAKSAAIGNIASGISSGVQGISSLGTQQSWW